MNRRKMFFDTKIQFLFENIYFENTKATQRENRGSVTELITFDGLSE